MPLRSPIPFVGLSAPAPRGQPTHRAFTLIELLVVITVIAILAGMLLAGIRAASGAARRSATKQLLRQVATATTSYSDAYGETPPERTPDPNRLYSSECVAVFLGAGLLPDETSWTDVRKRAVRSKRNFLTLKSSLVFDQNKNGFREIIDAWGLPIVYNRREFPPGNNPLDWSLADPNNAPLHNPKGYDLFSCGPLASRMAQLGRQLPNLQQFEANALNPFSDAEAHNSKYQYLYRYEFRKLGRQANQYIGNW